MSAGPSDSKPTSGDAPSTGRSFPLHWTRIPSIRLLRPQQGRFSPKVDERCFTYCSQSVRGRLEHGEPWCRSICLRRIFAHEVKRTLAAHDGTKHSKHPLPPEGQQVPGLFNALFGQPEDAQRDRDEKYWEEGYYLWASKSRWAAQEKMDLMMYDLEQQEQWQRYKKQANERLAQIAKGDTAAAEQPPSAAHAQNADVPPVQKQPVVQIPLRPFPDPTTRSILLPLPPPFPPIQEQIHNLLAPTHKLLEIVHETVRSGEQWGFVRRIWEKAQTREPLLLAQNVCSKMWEKWKDGPPDDEDVGRR